MRLVHLPLDIQHLILSSANGMLARCNDSSEFISEVNKILGADYQSPYPPKKEEIPDDQSN